MSQTSIEELAQSIRVSAQHLANTPISERRELILLIANALITNQERILEKNKLDIENGQKNNISSQLIARLKLTPEKLENLADGLKQLATLDDPLNKVLKTTLVSEGLLLTQKTVPLGVILIIFESRPDALVQIATLTLYSGNGVILKGGTEAQHSNTVLHEIIQECIVELFHNKYKEKYSILDKNRQQLTTNLKENIVSLVHHRNDIKDLLQCDKYIDLVIPRGSNQLVSFIQKNTTIPVMGHSEGVCHIYVDDENRSIEKVCKIIVDSKCNYPSACNALEMLVLNKGVFLQDENNKAMVEDIFKALENAKVELFFTPELISFLESKNLQNITKYQICTDIHREYGELQLSVHIVDSINDAITFINSNSSHHTESILTDNKSKMTQFLNYIDSASVYVNTSTRFADGQRYGLGAEIGISTSRLHARGPVGLEGLVTYKWLMVSDQDEEVRSKKDGSLLSPGHTVTEFASKDRIYIHKHE